MHWRTLFSVCGSLVLLLLPSCSSAQPDLAGTAWTLEQDSQYGQVNGLGLTSVTLEFEFDGSVTGTHAYLKYGGSYSAEEGTLSITDVRWTSMACQAETGLADRQSYLDALMTAESYSVENDRLVIDIADGEMVFERVEE
ncbi:MAG: META domain-containing protein [Chloroflexota bacterium]